MRDFVMFVSGRQSEVHVKTDLERSTWREECQSYFRRLEREHGHTEGSQLRHNGRDIYMDGHKIVVDGPFAETKEVLNGYIRFQANSFEEALDLAKQFPSLKYGESVQVFETTQH